MAQQSSVEGNPASHGVRRDCRESVSLNTRQSGSEQASAMLFADDMCAPS